MIVNQAKTTLSETNTRAGEKSDDMLDYLLRRRSVATKHLTEPGPNREQINTMLQAAARVPDHGRMFPWYFIVFEGENRTKAGELLVTAYKAENPDAAPAKLELEANRFLETPTVIAVISRVREGKHPLWEQILSAGAACQNLTLAAHAMGFATNWKTGWYSYSEHFKNSLGLDQYDHIAGFFYIGTPSEQPEERARPLIGEITTFWETNADLNKGSEYGYPGKGFAHTGFDFSRSGK